jgi:hypothetical protein
MDNCLHVTSPAAFEAVISFMKGGVKGVSGYVSPNRMNKKRDSAPSAVSQSDFIINGQNKCARLP